MKTRNRRSSYSVTIVVQRYGSIVQSFCLHWRDASHLRREQSYFGIFLRKKWLGPSWRHQKSLWCQGCWMSDGTYSRINTCSNSRTKRLCNNLDNTDWSIELIDYSSGISWAYLSVALRRKVSQPTTLCNCNCNCNNIHGNSLCFRTRTAERLYS